MKTLLYRALRWNALICVLNKKKKIQNQCFLLEGTDLVSCYGPKTLAELTTAKWREKLFVNTKTFVFIARGFSNV